MRVECPQVPSGVPAPARCTLVRTTLRVPSTRPHACLPGRPFAWSPVHSLARLPAAHSPPTIRAESVITERTAVLARTDARAPHATCPRHGPTLCVSTRMHPCTHSPACLPPIGACSPARKKIEWSCSCEKEKEGGGGRRGGGGEWGSAVLSSNCRGACGVPGPQFPETVDGPSPLPFTP